VVQPLAVLAFARFALGLTECRWRSSS
jgi:hypothetical protein